MSENLKTWECRLQQMKDCKSVAELVSRFGQPPHKDQQDEFEIWHYPLGAADGKLYSIHVSVWPDQFSQIYLFFEPTHLGDSPAPRARWQRWAGAVALLASLVLGYLSIYSPIVSAMHHGGRTEFFTKLAIGLPALLYVGLVLMIFGDKSSSILGARGRESRMQLTVLLVLVVLGFLLFLWVDSVVEGYSQ